MSKILSDYNSNFKISSNVAKTIVYSDLNLSFNANPITKDINPVTDIDAVKGAIKNLVMTNFHERPFQPTLAGGLNKLLFEPATLLTGIAIKEAIEKVINNHEPRVTDVTVQVSDNPEMNSYHITIGFRVVYDRLRTETSFYLVRIR